MKEVHDYLLNFFKDDSTQLRRKNRIFMKDVFERVMALDRESIERLYLESSGTRYSIQGYLESVSGEVADSDRIVAAGYTTAIEDFMQLFLQRKDVDESIKRIRTSYKHKILCILKERGSILHKDLAAEIDVSPSGLNAIIKMMHETDIQLINIDKVSKYKIYSLTPIAYQYLSQKDAVKETGNQRKKATVKETGNQRKKATVEVTPYIIYRECNIFEAVNKASYILGDNCIYEKRNAVRVGKTKHIKSGRTRNRLLVKKSVESEICNGKQFGNLKKSYR